MERVDTLLEGLIREDPAALKLWQEERPRARLAAALVRVRRAFRLTQLAVAKNMGLEQSNVARIESSQGSAQTTEALTRYTRACGLTLESYSSSASRTATQSWTRPRSTTVRKPICSCAVLSSRASGPRPTQHGRRQFDSERGRRPNFRQHRPDRERCAGPTGDTRQQTFAAAIKSHEFEAIARRRSRVCGIEVGN